MDERLKGQPFGHESVERRQTGDGHRTDEERASGPRHAPQQPANTVQVVRLGRTLDRTGAHEEECFEDGVVQDVEHCGNEGDAAPEPLALPLKQEPAAQAHGDDADVLDRVEGQQLLQLTLEQGVHHPADCG